MRPRRNATRSTPLESYRSQINNQSAAPASGEMIPYEKMYVKSMSITREPDIFNTPDFHGMIKIVIPVVIAGFASIPTVGIVPKRLAVHTGHRKPGRAGRPPLVHAVPGKYLPSVALSFVDVSVAFHVSDDVPRPLRRPACNFWRVKNSVNETITTVPTWSNGAVTRMRWIAVAEEDLDADICL